VYPCRCHARCHERGGDGRHSHGPHPGAHAAHPDAAHPDAVRRGSVHAWTAAFVKCRAELAAEGVLTQAVAEAVVHIGGERGKDRNGRIITCHYTSPFRTGPP